MEMHQCENVFMEPHVVSLANEKPNNQACTEAVLTSGCLKSCAVLLPAAAPF